MVLPVATVMVQPSTFTNSHPRCLSDCTTFHPTLISPKQFFTGSHLNIKKPNTTLPVPFYVSPVPKYSSLAPSPHQVSTLTRSSPHQVPVSPQHADPSRMRGEGRSGFGEGPGCKKPHEIFRRNPDLFPFLSTP